MNKNLMYFVVLFLALHTAISAGDRSRYDYKVAQMDARSTPVNYAPININPVSVVFFNELSGPFSVDSITIGAEISTQLTGYDDYKTNGEVNHFLQVDPSDPITLHAVDVQTSLADPTGATSRRTNYGISTDAGATWLYVLDVPDGRRSGFPVLGLKNGSAVIANHSVFADPQIDAFLYVDVAPLAGTFIEYPNQSHTPFGIWPQMTVLNNGNVVMLSRRNVSGNDFETLYVNIWNGGTTIGTRTPFYMTSNNYIATVGSNMQFQIANNGAGEVTGVAYPVLNNDTLFASKMYSRKSTDNGATWGPLTTVYQPYTQGADTIAASAGIDLKYKPNSSTWFMSYVESKHIAGGGVYGSAVLKVRRSDGNIYTLTNAAEVGAATEFAAAMSFVFSIDNPSIGFSRDGKGMYCVYTVVKPDTSRGYNQRDLYFQYSFNDGANWSAPIRLTNTITIDEAYPSVSNWNKGNAATGENYELNFVYMKDPGVGPTTFGGTAPASLNTTVYRKITFGPPIGIKNIGSDIPRSFSLAQNYPNPFNPVTKIRFAVPKSGNVSLNVYDISGKLVKSIVKNEFVSAGNKEVEFNASDLSSGIYFYILKADNYTETKKMVLVK